MSVLDELERLALAAELLRRRARVSIAHHETGVSRPRLRRLHWELHGRGRRGEGHGRLLATIRRPV